MLILEGIDHGHGFDWSRTSDDYARYRDIYPSSFYENIEKMGLCPPGGAVLDLGTGTGVLPRGLYGSGAHFTGADIAPGQIEAARRLSQQAGMEIDYVVGPAEGLTLPDASFDTVLAAMCFVYMDPEAVLPNIHRMLRPGGHFARLSMLWLPEEDEVARGSERLILQYNPSWTGGGYQRRAPSPPEWAGPLFTPDCTHAYVEEIPFTREAWQGRIRASRGVGAALDEEAIHAFEAEHAAFLQGFAEPLMIPHYITMEVFERV